MDITPEAANLKGTDPFRAVPISFIPLKETLLFCFFLYKSRNRPFRGGAPFFIKYLYHFIHLF